MKAYEGVDVARICRASTGCVMMLTKMLTKQTKKF
jgi:hypothetical protein